MSTGKRQRGEESETRNGVAASVKSPKTEHHQTETQEPQPKRRIFLNAFDMFTVGHMSFGQWRNPKDKTATKRRDLTYWTNLAKLLEKGDFNAI